MYSEIILYYLHTQKLISRYLYLYGENRQSAEFCLTEFYGYMVPTIQFSNMG